MFTNTPRVVLCVLIACLVATLPLQAVGQDVVPADQALKELQQHADLIQARRDAADKRYGKSMGESFEILTGIVTKGAEKSGAKLDALRYDTGKSWARNFGSLTYNERYNEIYKYHAATIEASMANVRHVGSTRRDKLQAVKDGMAEWAEKEKPFLDRIEKSLELISARLVAAVRVAEEDAKSCAGPACERKKAAVNALTAKYNEAGKASGAAEEKLAEDFKRKFFEPIDMLRVRLDVRDSKWRQGWRAIKQKADAARAELDRIEVQLAKDGAAFKELASDSGPDGARHKEMHELAPKIAALVKKLNARARDVEKDYKASPTKTCGTTLSDCALSDKEIKALLAEYTPLAKKFGELYEADEDYHKRLAAARARLEAAVAAHEEAQRKYATLLDELANALRNPAIERVDVSADGALVHQMVFDASDAKLIAQLAILNDAIAASRALTQQAKTARDAIFAEFWREQILARDAARELTRVVYWNTLDQALVESLFQLVDVLWAVREGGPWGAIVEATVKIGENVTKYMTDTYGPDAFDGVNPKSIEAQIVTQMQADLTDPLALQQLGKAAISDGAQELISNRLKKMGNALNPKNLPDWQAFKASHTSSLEKMKQALKKVETRRAAAKSIGTALIKDAAKTYLQKLFNDNEIDLWTRYFEHDVRARLLWPYRALADQTYHDAAAALARAEAEKEALLKHHAGDHTLRAMWKLKLDGPVNPKAAMSVQVHLKQQAGGVKVEVNFARHDVRLQTDGAMVYGMRAAAQGGNSFAYTLPAQMKLDVPIQVSAE